MKRESWKEKEVNYFGLHVPWDDQPGPVLISPWMTLIYRVYHPTILPFAPHQ